MKYAWIYMQRSRRSHAFPLNGALVSLCEQWMSWIGKDEKRAPTAVPEGAKCKRCMKRAGVKP